ncbi:hypothetical protein [Sphingomonas sp. IC081]|uniref:hypothetical protein n=1 Tax=Sphingomonas sp. IC081 TaxID=304378 RepID=UPI001157EE05|nr:hypothetical protein [Sphingomonas sp. IC081]QDK32495.1 hypothetical protein DM450_06800 [Sphingomonas sp. IC081]
MKLKYAAGFCLLVSVAAAGQAQQQEAAVTPGVNPAVAPAEKQVAVLVAQPQDNILRAGLEVPLLTREELTTKGKKLKVGQRIQMEVAANIERNGMVVIPAGTPAIGEITEVRNKGMWGKSGYIGARVVSIRLGDRNIRVTGTFDDKGVTGTGGVVAAIAFVPIAGFLTTGTSAFIAPGSPVKGFLDEDVTFTATSAPAPIPVAATPVAPAASSGAQ